MSNNHIHQPKFPGRLIFSRDPLSVAFIPTKQSDSIPENIQVQYLQLDDYLERIGSISEREFFEFFGHEPFRVLEGIIPLQKLQELGIKFRPGQKQSLFITYIERN